MGMSLLTKHIMTETNLISLAVNFILRVFLNSCTLAIKWGAKVLHMSIKAFSITQVLDIII